MDTQAILEQLLPYVSGDDAGLPIDAFAQLVADRARQDRAEHAEGYLVESIRSV